MPRPVASLANTRALAARFTRSNGSPTIRFLILVGGLSIFGPLCVDMYLPALPTITENLRTSASVVQLSLTTCFIGLAIGQLLYGIASDRFGRRRPLLVGLSLFVVASVSCSIAPNAALLASLRFFQGLGGAAGLVISRAIVRDLFEGINAAKVFSMLMLMTGCGPVFAPQLGAELLLVTSWRGLFLVLGALGAILLVVAAIRIPETFSPELRSVGGFRSTTRTMRRIGTNLDFLQHAVSSSLGYGALFAYVAGASFALENVYHASPQTFGRLFALCACGLIGGSQLNAHIVRRYGSARLMTLGLVALAISGAVLLIVVTVRFGGLPAVVFCMFVAVTSLGFIGPNALALSLQSFPEVAGSASALLGLSQFGLGAIVAPLVGLRGSDDAFPMALIMAIFGISALLVRVLLTKRVARSNPDHLVPPVSEAPKSLTSAHGTVEGLVEPRSIS